MPSRRILLVDADAFFVAVARMVDPDGAGKEPLLIVGGSREGRGVVCSASYETRAFGVRSAMPISRAIRLCPDAVCVPVPGKACGIKSREIRAVLELFSPVVEGASVDEWYCDLGGTEALYKHEPLAVTAHRIRDAVRAQTGLNVSIGGGTTKLIAKLAVEYAKPKPGATADGVRIIADGAEDDFLRRLTLAEIPMVGPKFQQRLQRHGLRTVADVMAIDVETLERYVGQRAAEWLHARVHGIDEREVRQRDHQKSISRHETFRADLTADDQLARELLKLVVRAASDLRGVALAARTITVRIRDFDFRTRSAARSLPDGVVADRVIYATSRRLLTKLRASRRVPARLLGVTLSSLCDADSPGSVQFGLFDDVANESKTGETERDRKVARTVDAVREKFGPGAVMPGGVTDHRHRADRMTE